MNKTLLTVLVVVLVAGVFVEHSDALLRAGRDRIERLQRGEEPQKEQEMYPAIPVYFRRGENDKYRRNVVPSSFLPLQKLRGNYWHLKLFGIVWVTTVSYDRLVVSKGNH